MINKNDIIFVVLCFLVVNQFFQDLVQAIHNSNLQSFFYNMVSTIDYSNKEPLQAGVVDTPPQKK